MLKPNTFPTFGPSALSQLAGLGRGFSASFRPHILPAALACSTCVSTLSASTTCSNDPQHSIASFAGAKSHRSAPCGEERKRLACRFEEPTADKPRKTGASVTNSISTKHAAHLCRPCTACEKDLANMASKRSKQENVALNSDAKSACIGI